MNIYAPKIAAPKYIMKTNQKKDIGSNIVKILGDFITSLSKMDRSSKQRTVP